MSKKMKSFKEKMSENKGKSMAGTKVDTRFNIEVEENFNAVVERGTIRANDLELQEIIRDIFIMRKNINKGEMIKVSEMIDVIYDIKFLGMRTNGVIKEAHLKVY